MKMKKVTLILIMALFALVITLPSCTKDEESTNSTAYIGTWQGTYSGLDPMQQKTVYIRRELILNSNNTYSNKIGGNVTSASSDFDPWEEESGTYSVNNGIISYAVSIDKKINFNSQTLVTTSKSNYTERIDISNGEWGLKDEYLNLNYKLKKK